MCLFPPPPHHTLVVTAACSVSDEHTHYVHASGTETEYIFSKKHDCLMQINCKLKHFDSGRIISFTEVRIKMVAGDQASDFLNQLFQAIT